MFSTVQKDVLSSLIPVMRKQGYNYYIAYTNTNTDGSWNSSAVVDLYVVFSSEEITANDMYTYLVPSGAVRYAIRTANYSTSSSAVNTDRYVTSDYSGTLTVDVYEHIYTNAEFSTSSVQPDILYESEGGYMYEAKVGENITLAIFLFFIVFSSLIRAAIKRERRI